MPERTSFMRKMYVGIIVLVLLFAATLLNVRYLDSRLNSLLEYVNEAEALAEEKNFASAARTLQEAIDCWNGMDGYTHIFIRHSEIDSATDAFYEYLSDLCGGDGGNAAGSCQKLKAHITSIITMEHISLGSIF